MSNVSDRRYGDPSAPLWEMKRWVAVIAVVVLLRGVVLAAFAGIRMIQFGDEPNRVGTEIGIVFALLILGGAAIGWSIYWRALVRTFQMTRAGNPGSLVLGARIPNLDGGVLAKSWPPKWGPALAPQRVVVRVDEAGVVLVTAAVPNSSLLELSWSQVSGFARVEYVEARVAYQGLAIQGPESLAIVLQIITPSFFVRFPQGKSLKKVAVQADGQRPSRE